LQNGAKSPSRLWQTWKDPPAVDAGAAPEEVVGCCESPVVKVVVAVKIAGAALIVVAAPLTVVRTGVIVAMGLPLVSTETHGSKPDSVTENFLECSIPQEAESYIPCLGIAGLADTALLQRRAATAMKIACTLDACISRISFD